MHICLIIITKGSILVSPGSLQLTNCCKFVGSIQNPCILERILKCLWYMNGSTNDHVAACHLVIMWNRHVNTVICYLISSVKESKADMQSSQPASLCDDWRREQVPLLWIKVVLQAINAIQFISVYFLPHYSLFSVFYDLLPQQLKYHLSWNVCFVCFRPSFLLKGDFKRDS